MSADYQDRALIALDRAQSALGECRTVMEAKKLADAAEAARIYLERTHASEQTVARAAEIRTLAVSQMGEFLREMPKNQGALPGKTGAKAEPVLDPTPTLASIGITKKESSQAQKLAAIPRDERERRIRLLKATGQQPTPAKVLAVESSVKPAGPGSGEVTAAEMLAKSGFKLPADVAAEAAEAAKDSAKLWRLKCLWKKTGKRDRAAFKTWIQTWED
jgi:hypothetical protein